jgi:hypothetical protein
MSDDRESVVSHTECHSADNRDPVRPRIGLMLAAWSIIATLWLLFGVVLLGDVGFDHPGRFGLDFEAFLILGILYLVLLASGIVIATMAKNLRITFVLLGSCLVHLATVLVIAI